MVGKQMFDDLGYVEIGMDRFALKTDNMYTSMADKTLHRNFMGYTTNNTQFVIGLGMSSISDLGTVLRKMQRRLKNTLRLLKKVKFQSLEDIF